MTIKRFFSYTAIVAFMLVSCSKSSGGGSTPTPPTPPVPPVPEVEENIVFSFDPDPGASTVSATAGTYKIKVNISSKLPSSGVKIQVTTKKDADNSNLEPVQSITSTVASTEITIGATTPIAQGTLYNVAVVVESVKTSTNSSTKSFKISRK